MLSQRLRCLHKLSRPQFLSKISSYNFSNLKDPNDPNKEIYDSIIRSSTVSKTAFKSFLEAQELVSYFPMKDPVRVAFLKIFHSQETFIRTRRGLEEVGRDPR